MADEQKELQELARRVADCTTSGGLDAQINALVHEFVGALKSDINHAALESLLLYRGRVAQRQDSEWARAMGGIYLQQPDAEVPTNPHEMRLLVQGWQADRERELAKRKQSDGFRVGFQQGLAAGVKFGWGGCNVGKSLEEVQAGAADIKPSL